MVRGKRLAFDCLEPLGNIFEVMVSYADTPEYVFQRSNPREPGHRNEAESACL